MQKSRFETDKSRSDAVASTNAVSLQRRLELARLKRERNLAQRGRNDTAEDAGILTVLPEVPPPPTQETDETACAEAQINSAQDLNDKADAERENRAMLAWFSQASDHWIKKTRVWLRTASANLPSWAAFRRRVSGNLRAVWGDIRSFASVPRVKAAGTRFRIGFPRIFEKRHVSDAFGAFLVFCAAVGFGAGLAVGWSFISEPQSELAEAPRQETLLTLDDFKLTTLERVMFVPPVPTVVAPSPPPGSNVETDSIAIAPLVGASPTALSAYRSDIEAVPALFEISAVNYVPTPPPEMRANGISLQQESDTQLSKLVALTKPELPRVFIHAPTGVSTARLRAVSSDISAAGAEVALIGRETFRVSTTHIRYYTADTAQVAMALAEELQIEARDFTEGTSGNERIELWVAGRAAGEVATLAEPASEKRWGWWHRDTAR